ncbi:hypothetical protein PV11_01751 [Exophiala sideris]|uniref:4-coumarate-CoA ligase n=1 Tax=Exophiala sideris TaxID=1016849 RepID=A0A0D1XDS9_9EURO|nr:hypothetical protein PV11_01751 [Exophiala sideris]
METPVDATKVYRNITYPSVNWPKLDLLSLLFGMRLAKDDTVLHAAAEVPPCRLTKRELKQLSQRIAHCLRTSYSIGANGPNKDVVTVISYGQVMAPAVFFGIIAAGGVYSAASASSTVDELVHQVQLARSQVIICSSEVKAVAWKAAITCHIPPENVLILESTPSLALKRALDDVDLLSQHRLDWQKITEQRQLAESIIVVIWSSGTTGVPKGVMLSHANLVSQVFITHFQGREAAHKQVEQGTYEHVDFRTLAHLPASHISGLFGYFISAFYGGGPVVWMRKYQWDHFLQYIKQYQITYLFTVPSIYLRIAKSSDVTDQFAHLKGAGAGSAPMDANLQASASARLGIDKSSLVAPSWGLSETTGAVTLAQTYQGDEVGSLGPILPCLEVRLVNDGFSDVNDGEPGELLVRGPTVMRGYLNNATATAEAFHDGWFRTGDIAVRRDGKFYMVDRKKELLKYKGLQIAPAELEHLLVTHPAIREAAVIGVPAPDDPSSELPRAYVVVVGLSGVSVEEVMEFVKARSAPHKQLRGGVVFVDEIPKNASGKILRRELRERAKKEAGRERARL